MKQIILINTDNVIQNNLNSRQIPIFKNKSKRSNQDLTIIIINIEVIIRML